jgi:hypothetical protein
MYRLYRPKFCAECGGKIVRLRWHLWNSRRFCGTCSPRFLKEQFVQVVTGSAAVLLLGFAIGHAARSAAPPLVIQRSQELRLSSSSGTTPAGTRAAAPAPLTEEVYTCGARTKKGTPCSRRVHGPVRCWQHKGMPAMLPQEKLRIKE